MTRALDETFLNVHPRTLLWWEERKLCEKCAHVRISETTASWTCNAAFGRWAGRPANGGDRSCIRVRESATRCGPEGRLFKPRADV